MIMITPFLWNCLISGNMCQNQPDSLRINNSEAAQIPRCNAGMCKQYMSLVEPNSLENHDIWMGDKTMIFLILSISWAKARLDNIKCFDCLCMTLSKTLVTSKQTKLNWSQIWLQTVKQTSRFYQVIYVSFCLVADNYWNWFSCQKSNSKGKGEFEL